MSITPTDFFVGAVPPLGFRFSVAFLHFGLIPNPLDFMFQKVSGICSTVATRTVNEGGQNLYSHRIPERIEYENLVLERGLTVLSPLVLEFDLAMMLFKFNPCNVLVILHDNKAHPITAWLFRNAYPVKWEVSEFNANENEVVIERMELAYQNMLPMRV